MRTMQRHVAGGEGGARPPVAPIRTGGRWLGSILAAAVVAGCGGGAEVSVAAPATTSQGGTAPADLSSPDPVADHPEPAVRAGAAGQQVSCDGPVHLGGWAADFGGPHEGAADPQAALEAFLDQGLFGLPSSGYGLASSQGDRVLFTHEVEGAAKIAVIVVDGGAEQMLGVPDGWVIETFATCDPAEYASATDDELRQSVWTDGNGERVATSRVTSFSGHEHCGWQAVTFLHLEGQRQYLRDPDQLLVDRTVVPYDGDVQLPADAVDTGYRHGARQLWLAADGTVAYLVTDANVEAWPATSEQVGCR